MSSPHTTPTSPGSPKATSGSAHRVEARLLGYRILAYATGVMLLVLAASVVLHRVFGDERLTWVGPVHGFLYMGYLVATALLGTSMGWRTTRLVWVALAGMIPLMSFVAERKITHEVRGQLTTP
jgi:integral membrane protein